MPPRPLPKFIGYGNARLGQSEDPRSVRSERLTRRYSNSAVIFGTLTTQRRAPPEILLSIESQAPSGLTTEYLYALWFCRFSVDFLQQSVTTVPQ